MIIDADTHILEGEHTWDFMEPHEQRFRPEMVPNWWIVDGITRRRGFDDARIPEGVRQMTDVQGRIDKMDEFGVDVQVVYPSLQLAPTTEQPEALLALCRSYNRFMANACSQSKGRLRWVIIPAVDTMPEALAELEFGKANGACGVLLRGMEGKRALGDRYFDPLYEKAQALNLPICVHTGIANRTIWDLHYQASEGAQWSGARAPVLSACHSLLMNSVPDRFPTLRFGFIEAGATWVPYIVSEVMRNLTFRGVAGLPADKKDLIPAKRMFIACRIDDDLDYLLRWTGKKNLMTGTDFGHNDTSTELFAMRDLPQVGNIDREAIDGITGNNAQTFYAIAEAGEKPTAAAEPVGSTSAGRAVR